MSYSWGNDTAASWGNNDSKGFDYGSAKAGYGDDDKGKSYASSPKSASPKSAKSTSPAMDMKSAYAVSKRVLDAAIADTEKDLLKLLTPSDLLVVQGQYDSVEKVLASVGTPYQMLVKAVDLDPKQTLLINCPGTYNYGSCHYKRQSGLDAVRKFVEDGGFVVTTDWSLENVIMKAFPGFIAHKGTDTRNDLVEVNLVAAGSPYTKGLGGGSLKPIWWLETQSYPIKPVNEQGRVDILLGSEEMAQRYGFNPIAVKFAIGNGRVIHVTSHFYLQTTHSKYDAQERLSGLDFVTKFVGLQQDEAAGIDGIGDVSFGALESAYTSVRFLHNIFLEKIRKNATKATEALPSPEELKRIGGSKAVSLRKLPPGPKSKDLI